MPEMIRSGGSLRSPWTANFTQSLGVPVVHQAALTCPSYSISCTRSGLCSVSACPVALRSRSGATTKTSFSVSLESLSARTRMPRAYTPSSLDTRILNAGSALFRAHAGALRLDTACPYEIVHAACALAAVAIGDFSAEMADCQWLRHPRPNPAP